MSVVIAKSVCFVFFDSIMCEMLFFTAAKIMWFGQPGHQVFSDFVPRLSFICLFLFFVALLWFHI